MCNASQLLTSDTMLESQLVLCCPLLRSDVMSTGVEWGPESFHRRRRARWRHASRVVSCRAVVSSGGRHAFPSQPIRLGTFVLLKAMMSTLEAEGNTEEVAQSWYEVEVVARTGRCACELGNRCERRCGCLCPHCSDNG